MKRILTTLLLCVAAVALKPGTAWADLRVVATVPALGALIEDIGGAHVDVTTLASLSQDPHYVEARPDFILALSRADLVVAVGMDLEVGWLPTLRQQARNPAIASGNGYFEAASAVSALDVPTQLDRSQGDVHAGGNPHFTYDPRALAAVAVVLGERMATLDPAQQSHYRAGAAAASEALLTLAALERERFAALPESDRQIASYHASLPYLLDWLSLRQIATLEPRPGVPPTPGHTAQVISTMRSDGARAIVQESYYPASTSETIATLVGGAVVRIDSGPNLAAQETTVDWLTRTAEAIYVALH